MGDQYRRGFQRLLEEGWVPDVVLSHSGWGCGLHVAGSFPEARRISYLEWWFAPPKDPLTDQGWKQRQRNLPLAMQLCESDVVVAPTHWQRRQLPKSLRHRCQVIGDGVDLDWFSPLEEQRHPAPLLTYGTRGMEPTRGFPDFVNALPAALETWEDLEVEIAGEDRICYGGAPPPGFQSYGTWAHTRLSQWVRTGRVRFLGRLEPEAYRSWLRRSWVHVYLTKPFVASWSLLEAMATGCTLIASKTEPVLEFLRGDLGGRLVARTDTSTWLRDALDELLGDRGRRERLGAGARELARMHHSGGSAKAWDQAAGLQTLTHAVDPLEERPVLSGRFAPVLQPNPK